MVRVLGVSVNATPWGDVAIAAILVFLFAFGILSGTALNPRNRPGQAALKGALRLRLLLSAVFAALAAAWVARKS